MSKPVSSARKPVVDLRSLIKDPLQQRVFSIVGGAVEKVLALDGINQIYYSAADADPRQDFLERLLDVMNIETAVTDADLARIPRTGPVVVVANHPFGGIEGIVLAALLRAVRPDVKLMANFLLKAIPDLHDAMIFVDPFDRDVSAKVNLRPIKECVRWLRQGGALGVFPAGAVSHMDLRRGGVTDPEWSPTIARLIQMTEAPVLPVFFRGTNSLLFQILGMVHPRLRTGMLPRELVNKRNRTLEVRIGHVVPHKRLAGLDDRALMDYLRDRTYHLRRREVAREKKLMRRAFPLRFLQPKAEPVADPESPERLRDEVASLRPEQCLVVNGPYDVYVAESGQIPRLLLEIGRLRETTFRAVQEGTGRARDLDRFDDYYLHLFVWNRERQEVVGAYRLGLTDVIVKQLGLHGLYTSTLFRYRKKLLDRINPALEMGRSFIRVEYQKNFSPLLLLWKGIGVYVARHPRYRHLFGPVSISSEYQTSSRLLLVAFLKASSFLPQLARLVRPRKPLRTDPLTQHTLRRQSAVVRDLDEVESLIADLETDLKGIPVLLRQYLRLGGKLLAFNEDPAFSNVLDGLILVDLVKTDPTLLAKYMGADEVKKFHAFHGG